MREELRLRRKWTFRAHNKQLILIKKSIERPAHVFMKAFIWALYLPEYPTATVEIHIGDRYKPDVVALNAQGHPQFWGEAGHISSKKIQSLVRRYRDTHFVVAKWGTSLRPFEKIVSMVLAVYDREVPFDLINFSEDSVERFIDGQGYIQLTFDDIEWVRLS